MTDRDFCLSSYIAFRYIWKDGVDFCEGFQHTNYRPIDDDQRIAVSTSEDIDREIQRQFDDLYAKYDSIGILLSVQLCLGRVQCRRGAGKGLLQEMATAAPSD